MKKGVEKTELQNSQEYIRRIKKGERDYPKRLLELSGAPKELYVLGKLPTEQLPAVAVIGARDCSEYGKYVAAQLGSFFGRNGVQVISGMARGIDGIAQEAALDAGGSSFAVLGSGVDVCYPVGNKRLYEKLKLTGGVLSEYPVGTPAYSWNFPPRNRIVSGLADVVIVVEARAKSGTLITVDMALEQGREVYVIPGRVTDGLSAGCNRLLKLGAGMLLDPQEFLEELREIHANSGHGGEWQEKGMRQTENRREKFENRAEEAENKKSGELSPECCAVLEALDFYPQSVEQIQQRLPEKYRGQALNIVLIRLCMEQLAVQVSPGQFCRRSGE